jgi:type VI protein secretion system component Hcp
MGNIVEFIKYKLKNVTAGYEVYNYVDKPDLNMNQLVTEVEQSLSKNPLSTLTLRFRHVRWLLL